MVAKEFRKLWAEKLKVPALKSKPKRRVKKVNFGLGLYAISRFMHSLPPSGPNRVIIEKVSLSKCAFIIGSTLHVNAIHLCTRNELNFISLVTHFQLVDKVRIHTFHLDIYLTSRRAHVRIQTVRWEIVKLILQFVNRGSWVVKGTKFERTIKIKFDDFLKPAIEAWRIGLPFTSLLFDLPEYKTDLITTYHNLLEVHKGVSTLAEGYSSDSEIEVDFAHDEVDNNSDGEYDIMKINGCPFLLVSP